jgi:hypothetical protein
MNFLTTNRATASYGAPRQGAVGGGVFAADTRHDQHNRSNENPKRALSRWRGIALAFSSVGILAICLISQSATAATTNLPPITPNSDISAFNLLTERNIFNPRRSPRYVPSQRRESRRTVRPDAFALVGTMTYDKGPIAFFDGSHSEFKEVAKPGDTIAGFKVTDIEASAVKLSSPSNNVDLKIGMQLQRQENGSWQVTERPEWAEPAAPVSTISHLTYQTNSIGTNGTPGLADLINGLANGIANGDIPNFPPPDGEPQAGGQAPPSFSTTNTAPASSGSDSDVLLRLMQRRAQENNQ